MGHRLFAALAVFFFCANALAQVPQTQSPPTQCELSVRVLFQNEQEASDQIRVDLLNDTDIMVQQTFTDSNGRVTFVITAPGYYTVRASGRDVEEARSERILVDPLDKSKVTFVRVKAKFNNATSVPNVTTKPGNPNVASAAELKIPADANKAFQKGMESSQHQDFAKAAEYFEKATALYPEYDAAFNNLGVVYARLQQPAKAMEAFERSVQINDRNADADRNLARMLMATGQFVRAEGLLKKSLMVEPLNTVSLALVCITQVETGDFDGAIVSALKTHELPHEGYAIVHYAAGQALERKNDPKDAVQQYQTYLKENPYGPEAPQVRAALTRLTGGTQASAQ